MYACVCVCASSLHYSDLACPHSWQAVAAVSVASPRLVPDTMYSRERTLFRPLSRSTTREAGDNWQPSPVTFKMVACLAYVCMYKYIFSLSCGCVLCRCDADVFKLFLLLRALRVEEFCLLPLRLLLRFVFAFDLI